MLKKHMFGKAADFGLLLFKQSCVVCSGGGAGGGGVTCSASGCRVVASDVAAFRYLLNDLILTQLESLIKEKELKTKKAFTSFLHF